jgi:teichuronic acid biosynthesis glycosyltransferase TuaC
VSISEEAACSPGRLHVLTITPFYPTATDDANGCFVAEPLTALSRLGVVHSIFAVAPIYRRVIPIHSGVLPAQWVRYFALPGGLGLSSSGAFLFSRLLSRVRGLHTRMPIDVIHAHGPLPSGHAAMLLHRELAIPFVVSVHGLDAYSDRQVSGRPGEWCRRVSRLVFQSADRVVCISEHVREQVLRGEPSSKTSVTYNGADPVIFAPLSDDAARSSSPAPQQIVSIGNLIPTKGHEVLLKALAALSAKYPSLVCEIVGDGPLREQLGSLAKELRLGERVRFLGRRSRTEVASLLRSATLFVLPSSYEGLGCVYLEAMASGIPAIGCLTQGIEEIIHHGRDGWLVAPNDVDDLVRGLATFLENEQLRELIAIQGRDTVLQNYTIAHQAQRLLRIYRECAS